METTQYFIKPWWQYLASSSSDGCEIDTPWAEHGLAFQALEYKLTVIFLSIVKTISNKNLQLLIEDLVKVCKGQNVYNCEPYRMIFVWPQGLLKFYLPEKGNDKLTIHFVYSDPKLAEEVLKLFNKYTELYVPKGQVSVFIPTMSGLKSRSIGIGSIPLITDNYTPEVLEGFTEIVRELKSATPNGRLTIIDGPPGTGKTYMIRGLLHELPSHSFLILPSNMLDSMTGPQLIDALLNEVEGIKEEVPQSYYKENVFNNTKPSLILIIEDADICLNSRSDSNISSLSSLLNITDGIIGNLLDLRVICTTNSRIEKFDEAILRDGRLSTRLEIELLNVEQATALYNKLGGKEKVDWEGKKFLSLATVYAKVKGTKENNITTSTTNRKVGF